MAYVNILTRQEKGTPLIPMEADANLLALQKGINNLNDEHLTLEALEKKDVATLHQRDGEIQLNLDNVNTELGNRITKIQTDLQGEDIKLRDRIKEVDTALGVTNTNIQEFKDKMAEDLPNKADLGDDGKVLDSQLPNLAITQVFNVANQVEMLSLAAETGDIALYPGVKGVEVYILKTKPAEEVSNWVRLNPDPTAPAYRVGEILTQLENAPAPSYPHSSFLPLDGRVVPVGQFDPALVGFISRWVPPLEFGPHPDGKTISVMNTHRILAVRSWGDEIVALSLDSTGKEVVRYRSVDAGINWTSWTLLDVSTMGTPSITPEVLMTNLRLIRGGDQQWYVSVSAGVGDVQGVWSLKEDGRVKTQFNPPPGHTFQDFCLKGAQGSVLVGEVASPTYKVFVSSDGGDNWILANLGDMPTSILPRGLVTCIPTDTPGELLCVLAGFNNNLPIPPDTYWGQLGILKASDGIFTPLPVTYKQGTDTVTLPEAITWIGRIGNSYILTTADKTFMAPIAGLTATTEWSMKAKVGLKLTKIPRKVNPTDFFYDPYWEVITTSYGSVFVAGNTQPFYSDVAKVFSETSQVASQSWDSAEPYPIAVINGAEGWPKPGTTISSDANTLKFAPYAGLAPGAIKLPNRTPPTGLAHYLRVL